MAVALSGSRSPTVHRALAAMQAMSAIGPCSVVGHRLELDPAQAAFINSLSASAQAYDDTHLPTITHPGAPVVAAAWSVAEDETRRGRSLCARDLLLAIALGVEIQCRLSNAIVANGRGAHLGWYMTGLSGGIGAALSSSLLMDLPAEQVSMAIGLAAAQSAGVRSTHGSMATAFVPAFAARNGVISAYMAREGFTCTDHVLDGHNGLLDVLSASCEPQLLTHRLGEHFEMRSNAYKPYPCGIVIHAAIDACLAVGHGLELSGDDVEAVELSVHPSTLALCGKKRPETELDAQVSLFHWAACALLHPGNWLQAASLPLILDPKCQALQDKIRANADPGLERYQARARLTIKGGGVHEAYVEQATASSGKPMTDAQLDEKFLMLAQCVMSEAQSRNLLKRCRQLQDHEGDPLELIRQTRCHFS
jgi:2-methylcitrate dehydratase PrpD